MKTLWCKNQENPSDRISHAWAPLNFNFAPKGLYSSFSKKGQIRCTLMPIVSCVMIMIAQGLLLLLY
jgi:hypothetical protein